MRGRALASLFLGAWSLLLAGWLGYRVWNQPGPCADEIDESGWCGHPKPSDPLLVTPATLASDPNSDARHCPATAVDLDSIEPGERGSWVGCPVAAAGTVVRFARQITGAVNLELDTGGEVLKAHIVWSALRGRPELWRPKRGSTIRLEGTLQKWREAQRVMVDDGGKVESSQEAVPVLRRPPSTRQTTSPPIAQQHVSTFAQWKRGEAWEVAGRVVQVDQQDAGRYAVVHIQEEAPGGPNEAPRCVILTKALLKGLAEVPAVGEAWKIEGVVQRSGSQLCLKPLFLMQVAPVP